MKETEDGCQCDDTIHPWLLATFCIVATIAIASVYWTRNVPELIQ